MTENSKSAFTLVEISIVIIIVGLIIFSVTVGQELVRVSNIRAQIRQINEVKAAVTSFRDSYNGYPGDLHNAADYWGKDCDGATSGSDTCGGDGDQIIEGNCGASCHGSSVTISQEVARAFQHLNRAGFIEGVFTGATSGFAEGVNVINANIKNSFLFLRDDTVWGAMAGRYINFINISGYGTAADQTRNAQINAEGAEFIDLKLDDGFPYGGNMVAVGIESELNCTKDSSETTGKAATNIATVGYPDNTELYNVTDKNSSCYILIRLN
jgi:hypothetical protein